MTIADASIYTEFSGLTALKRQAVQDQDAAIDEVARQFEAIFLQQVLKEVRNASLGEGIMDNRQSQFYQEMYDQQLAQHLSQNGGIGLSEVLKRQLGGGTDEKALQGRDGLDQFPLINNGAPSTPIYGALQSGSTSSATGSASDLARASTQDGNQSSGSVVAETGGQGFESPDDFVKRLRPYAQEAADKLGVDADALIAQAALESGWGKRQISHANGESSHNLFGIKANSSWQGDRVAVSTLEYEGGVAVRKTEPFRAYESYRESFNDYANFILSNPRYGKALSVADDSNAYFSELQKAGYATDPNYANKLTSVLQSKHIAGS